MSSSLDLQRIREENLLIECFARASASILARVPPEERLAGLTVKQRLSVLTVEERLVELTPEQRLAGLTEAQVVLALPNGVLRGLSNEYLATLPRQTRAPIQKRLGGMTASPRPPARRAAKAAAEGSMRGSLGRRHMKENIPIETFDIQMWASTLARVPPEQLLASLTPKQLLAGLTPEERLAGLTPEERLAGLTEAQAVLALPDAVLRGLSDEYLATLPRETKAAIRKRLGGAGASPGWPARRRRSR